MENDSVNREKLDKLVQLLKNQIDIWYSEKINNDKPIDYELEIGRLCDFLVKGLKYPSEKIGEFLNYITIEKVDNIIKCNDNSEEYTVSIPKKIEDEKIEYVWILKHKHRRSSKLEITLYKNHSVHIHCWDHGGWNCIVYNCASLEGSIYGWVDDRM